MMWGGGTWWLIGALAMVVCIVMMFRMMAHGDHGGDHRAVDRPEGRNGAVEILAARFARGEISEEEFEQRMRVLEGSSH